MHMIGWLPFLHGSLYSVCTVYSVITSQVHWEESLLAARHGVNRSQTCEVMWCRWWQRSPKRAVQCR